MFISAEYGIKRRMAVIGMGYLAVTAVCALFGAIYESFSHGVYSYYMLYAFAFPLLGGTLPFTALALGKGARMPAGTPRRLYHFGLAALTVGSIVSGILEIYGTASDLTLFYWFGGGILVACGLGMYVYGLSASDQTAPAQHRR